MPCCRFRTLPTPELHDLQIQIEMVICFVHFDRQLMMMMLHHIVGGLVLMHVEDMLPYLCLWNLYFHLHLASIFLEVTSLELASIFLALELASVSPLV